MHFDRGPDHPASELINRVLGLDPDPLSHTFLPFLPLSSPLGDLGALAVQILRFDRLQGTASPP